MHDLARASFKDAIGFGYTHLLVDLPKMRGDENLGEVISKGIYPAITVVPARDLIGWKSEKDLRGMRRLTQIRIRECESAEGDEYEAVTVDRVRVFNAGAQSADPVSGEVKTGPASWELYERMEVERKPGGEKQYEWIQVDGGDLSYSEIPLITWYAGQIGWMQAFPPLEDLAWMNIRHWQSSSDQANILRFARVPQMYALGISQEEADKLSVTGVERILHSTAKDADIGILEHGGHAIDAGRADLQDIENRMETLGLQPFLERVSDSTATGVLAQQGGTMTLIQSWIRACEVAFTEALKLAHTLMGEANAPLDEDLSVDIYSDFSATTAGRTDLSELGLARGRGDISRKVWLHEAQRRSVLDEKWDVDDIAAEAEKEMSAAMSTGGFGGDSFGGGPGGGAGGGPGGASGKAEGDGKEEDGNPPAGGAAKAGGAGGGKPGAGKPAFGRRYGS